MKTFTNSIKEEYIHPGEEKTILERDGSGVITHMWFGGSYEYFDTAIVCVYIDYEIRPSIEASMYMMHCMGFYDKDFTFTTDKIGKTGDISGVYNFYRIPYNEHIKITVQMDDRAVIKDWFWSIVRGTEDMSIIISGVTLQDEVKLRLHKLENYAADPLEEFLIYNSYDKQGCLYLTAISAVSTNFNFQESCIRGYFNSNEPEYLSSGLEDYFLGTYYFQKGKYQCNMAGVTHLMKNKEFSGYRFHDDDPIFFPRNTNITCRCGEKIGDKIFHDPQVTTYTTYVWAYEW